MEILLMRVIDENLFTGLFLDGSGLVCPGLIDGPGLVVLLKKTPGLHLVGSAYTGVGIPDSIASGQSAAECLENRHLL